MKRTIRGSVILPADKPVPNSHVLYRKYAAEARAEAERFALDHGAILTDDPPVLVGTEPLGTDSARVMVVFELTVLMPEVAA